MGQESDNSDGILSGILKNGAKIFNEENILFEIPLVVAIFADLVPYIGFFAGFPYISGIVKSISDLFPDTMQIAVMAALFMIVFGFNIWGVLVACIIKSIPGVNLLVPIAFSILIIFEYKNSSSISTRNWYEPGTKQYSPISVLIRVIACIVLVIMLFGTIANTTNQLLWNVPTSIAVPLYEQALPAAETQYAKVAQLLSSPGAVFTALSNTLTSPVKSLRTMLDTQLSIATGGYYQGQVDKYADKNLGVFITEFKSAEQSFYLGTGDTAPLPIQAYATVAGAALEVDDCDEYPDTPAEGSPVGIYSDYNDCIDKQQINFTCKIPNKNIFGKTNPAKIDLFEIQDSSAIVDCTFNRKKFCKPSTEMVEFYAKFPFKTKSYLKTYIMDVLRYRDMKRQKMDPLLYYKITDTRPTAVYTGGPVMIGIGINDVMPMTVSTTKEDYLIPEGTTDTKIRSYSIGITLQNKWKGKIAEVTNLLVVVPPELTFNCPFFEPKALSTDTPGQYQLSETAKRQIKGEGGIKTSKTFNCRISATSAENAVKLLNNVPLATKYIQVTAEYQYEISQSTTLRLKSGDGEKMGLTDCNVACQDYDGCYCNVDCAPDYLAEVSHGFSCNNKYTSFPDPAPAPGCSQDTGATIVKELTAEEQASSQMEQMFGAPCQETGTQCYQIYNLPILGNVRLNPKVASAFQRAFTNIQRDGYAGLIRTSDYGGSYNYRMVRGGTTLSPHSWAVALDINVNMGPNAKRTSDGKSIDNYDQLSGTNFHVSGVYEPLKFLAETYFEPQGIAWGGRWTNQDAMHFEATRAE